jgi:hypothetical protein
MAFGIVASFISAAVRAWLTKVVNHMLIVQAKAGMRVSTVLVRRGTSHEHNRYLQFPFHCSAPAKSSPYY